MNTTIGGFSEGEIDGKPFHIFNFLSQNSSFYICQSFRTKSEWSNRRDDDYNRKDIIPVDIYPQFYNKRRGDEQFQICIGSNKIYDNPCKLPLVPLNNKETHVIQDFYCGACNNSELHTDYYACVDGCGHEFHKECIECPLEIKHPSFPFLSSLKLYYPPYISFLRCSCCQESINDFFYYSSTYDLMLAPVCALKPIPILIDHPKRHPHTLTFFPKQNFLPCDVCGIIDERFPTYICAWCVFVVHQDCIYSPYVIRISRHQHRISFTSSFPSGEFSCGVCRRKVDNNYGAYSCNKCDDYFVHTRCALRRDLWDGEELEGVPEEPEIVVEPVPFQRISDGIILHFSHDHYLELEMNGVYDEGKICQACTLQIYEDSYYSCMVQCDFILHRACANAPLEKQHALYAHPLTLNVTNEYDGEGIGYFSCAACWRLSCGFNYAYPEEHSWSFRLDLRCALVSEPYKYEGHEHPLFLNLTPKEEESTICQICQEEGDGNNDCKKLNCIEFECNFVICFKCATLPYKAKYKHDKHLLTFREKEETSSDDHPGWCDICEGKIEYSRKGGFYSCDDYCSTTVHVDCLLGEKYLYMKPGQTLMSDQEEIRILGNKTMSRPFCHGKDHRCPHKVVFEMNNMIFCSLSCLSQFKRVNSITSRIEIFFVF